MEWEGFIDERENRYGGWKSGENYVLFMRQYPSLNADLGFEDKCFIFFYMVRG